MKLNHPWEWKRACLIKPEGIGEWVAMWLRGWKVHSVITGEKFMLKYYHRNGTFVKL
jgi:hypothetical protein